MPDYFPDPADRSYDDGVLTLAQFVQEADARNLCWRLFCTTCGNLGLREAIRRLSQESSFPFAHDDADAAGPDAIANLAPLTHEEAERLAVICAEADLQELWRTASSSDWLGYLGVILDELTPFARQRLQIGRAWAPQFVQMGGDAETWAELHARAISWHDLETAEREIYGRGARPKEPLTE